MVHLSGGADFLLDITASFCGPIIILRSIGRTSVLALNERQNS